MKWKNKIFICEICGKEFSTKYACSTRIPKYCSYDCSIKSQTTKIKVKCDTCGIEVEKKQYHIYRSKKFYCSAKCKANSRLIKCDWCGVEFKRKPSEIKDHNFCSTECMGKWQSEYKTGENSNSWLGGWEKYYGANWLKQSRTAKERDNHVCQVCGEEEINTSFHVHHKVAFRFFGKENYKSANELSNLMTVCPSCHSSIEPRKHINLKQVV